MPELPERLRGRVLYQLHSLGAAGVPGANPDPEAAEPSGRGLRRLEGWLDHVRGLGCGGVLLTPVFLSSTHGYDTVDPFRIDQRLGDESDFAAFAAACHDLEVGEVSNSRLTYAVSAPDGDERLQVTLDLGGGAPVARVGWRPIAAGAGWSIQAPG